jgi:hypothetical protein
MTYQPGEQPFTQPQDPWSGTQGIASAPTDPIPAAPGDRGYPQPARGEFVPGVASPSVWSQETVAHGDPYATNRGGGGRAGLYVGIVLLIVVLAGAGGFGAWWAFSNYVVGPNTTPTDSPSTTGSPTSPTPTPTEVRYRSDLVAVGTCMINRNPAVNPPNMFIVACDWPGDLEVLQVLKVYSGEIIPEDSEGNFTADVTATPLCGDLDGYDRYYGWNSDNDASDRFYCMTTEVTAS